MSSQQVAVITGAAGGLGEGIARAAAARGMQLVLADVDEARLSAITSRFAEDGARAIAVPTDVSDAAALDRLADVAFGYFGGVSLLVNNAGVEMLGLSWEIEPEEWERITMINLLGPVNGVRAFAGRMIAAKAPAHIVNIASLAAVGMMPLQNAYVATKHALLAYSENLFLELQQVAPHVRVAVAVPGAMRTGIIDNVSPTVGGNFAAPMREKMLAMLGEGMCPFDAGTTILSQVLADKFWVVTHPELLKASAEARAHYLLERGQPSLGPAGDAFVWSGVGASM